MTKQIRSYYLTANTSFEVGKTVNEALVDVFENLNKFHTLLKKTKSLKGLSVVTFDVPDRSVKLRGGGKFSLKKDNASTVLSVVSADSFDTKKEFENTKKQILSYQQPQQQSVLEAELVCN